MIESFNPRSQEHNTSENLAEIFGPLLAEGQEKISDLKELKQVFLDNDSPSVLVADLDNLITFMEQSTEKIEKGLSGSLNSTN